MAPYIGGDLVVRDREYGGHLCGPVKSVRVEGDFVFFEFHWLAEGIGGGWVAVDPHDHESVAWSNAYPLSAGRLYFVHTGTTEHATWHRPDGEKLDPGEVVGLTV